MEFSYIYKVLHFCCILIHVNAEFSTSIISLSQQIRSMDEEIREVRLDFPRLEQKLMDRLELYESTRLAHLKTYLYGIVTDVVDGLVKDTSMERLLKNHVIHEIRDLRIRQNVMKRQQRRMSMEPSHLRAEKNAQSEIIRKCLKSIGLSGAFNVSLVKKVERENSSFRDHVWNMYDTLNQTVTLSLVEINSVISEVNQTCVSRMSTLKETLSGIDERGMKCATRLEGMESQISTYVKILNSSNQKTEEVWEISTALNVGFDILKEKMSQVSMSLSEAANNSDDLVITVSTNTQASSNLNEHFRNMTTRITTLESKCGQTGKEPKAGNRGQRSRLLMAAYKTEKTKSFQIDLRTNEIMSYPFLQMSELTSLTYDPTHDVILISSSNPEGIFSVDLDGNNMAVLKYNLAANGMRVDTSRDKIFLITSRTLCRMDTNGANFTIIKHFNQSEWLDIEIDTENQVIYIVNNSGMVSLNYTGEFIRWYDNVHHDIAFDPERQLMYFFHLGWVKETELGSGNHKIIWFIGWRKQNRVSITYNDNRLYIGLSPNERIFVINIERKSLSKIGRSRFQPDGYKYGLCLLP